jgi:nitrogen fixation protein FixH
MTARPTQRGTFTGRHMLAAMVAFFGVIVAVNVTMATLAMKSWTGLVVQNSYVASQQFNDRAEAGRTQAALGWQSDLAYSNGELRYSLMQGNGSPVALTDVLVALGRPAYEAEDTTIALAPTGDEGFGGNVKLGDGQWIVRVSAEAGLAEPWLDIRRIHVRNGAAR